MARMLPDQTQRGFDFSANTEAGPARVKVEAVQFRLPDPARLVVGECRLEEYLKNSGLGHVLQMRKMLGSVDLSALLSAYKPGGAPPYHPRVMLGLMLYGISLGVSSLRGLEELAVRDLGAWWMSGGIQPDHSAIGKFITRHQATLTDEFFTTLTRSLLRHLPSANGVVAGDGTVIEAAASRFKTIKKEAAGKALQEAQQAAQARPLDEELQARAAAAKVVHDVVEQRQEERRSKGREGEAQVSPSEPESVLQPRKDGAVRPSYKPSVLADSQRMIVGQHVEPTNEVAAIAPMLEQHQKVMETDPVRLLLDAGYFSGALLEVLLLRQLDVLIPQGKAHGADDITKQSRGGKQLLKNIFRYDTERDVYVCPEGKDLVPAKRDMDRHGQGVQRYKCDGCLGCPRKAECCPESNSGRSLRRYDHDDVKEGMLEVLAQPRARAAYAKRQAMVEPVFSALRGQQNLNRFRRRGLGRVAAEFSLHCMAYNLRRAARLVVQVVLYFVLCALQRWERIMTAVSPMSVPGR